MHTTHYPITPLDPNAHLFDVRCTVADPDPGGQQFRLPAWIPGGYLIREFARQFIGVRAECQGRPVAITKASKDLWRAGPAVAPLTVIATVYAFDLSVRTAYLDLFEGAPAATADTSNCLDARSPAYCARPADSSRASPIRPSMHGSSSAVRTRIHRTPASAITKKGPSWRWRSTSRSGAMAGDHSTPG